MRSESDGDVLGFLHALMVQINEHMTFDEDPTNSGTSAAEAFALKRGVCQDYAHIFIACARSGGVPARFVSGHFLRSDGVTSQPAGHAWAEAHIPDLGWIGFDAANGICTTDAHVRVAVGLDYLGAAPVRGTRYGIFKDYTVPMLESVFGTAGCLPEMIVSGMTDLQIIEEALRGEGITREHIASRKEELLGCYIREMRRATSDGDHIIMAMPGALEVLQAIIRLDPFPPSQTFGQMSMANHMLKRYGDAVHWCRECISRQPIAQWPHVTLACAYAQSGQLEEARAAAAEVLRINPGFTIESSKRILVYKDPKDLEHYIDGLHKAGLPES
jgi:hypothetical protein